jgi:hypothetical protein
MTASRGVLLVALALLAIGALRDFARLGDALPWRQLYDFADFYCAGSALDRGADPYRYEPLHACEHAVNGSPAYRADPNRVVPAPLPPYDFPPFMLAARLNFANARTVAAVAVAVAVLAAMWGMSLVGVPLELAALALVLPAGFVLLNAGQVVPFALVALVFCGVALARRADPLAGILAACTLIEPHLGLPVCLAMLLWTPRSRIAILSATAALGVIGAIVVGAAGVLEYVARVLPSQGAAEIGYVYQYSLTYLFRTLGAAQNAALVVGEVSYVCMLLFGVWLAGRAPQRLGRPELVAFLPAACSIVAGPYVHMVDISFAIPAALVLAVVSKGTARNLAAIALCLLAVPWIPVWIAKKLFLAALFVVAAIFVRLRTNAAVSLATFGAIAVAIYLLELAPPAPLVATTVGTFTAADLAQRAWSAYVAQLGSGTAAWLAIKVPTWIGLVTMLALFARLV